MNPAMLPRREWATRMAQPDSFVTQVWHGSKRWLVEQA